ncbi:GTPase domain-containing protein [candidate division KSB1 bacterium]|nr:GTPase domain-containing protein [candidate division KSB1 bacterium]
MRLINGQLYIKILFFGTALAGKTTTLNWVYQNVIPNSMKKTSEIKSINTSFGQTMLFDFVPIKISDNINFRFFTATGQDYYAGTRKLLFQEVDGVFYVVDSQKAELEHNKEFVDEFYQHVNTYFKSLKDISVVVLFNKQDLEDIYKASFLKKELALDKFPSYETSAVTGKNLKLAFSRMIKICLRRVSSNQLYKTII